ncbi:hypothetical protein GE300_02575 [Rhodobacteraceae bacterium 2CG4]|uniref:Allophanate hydrolase C-terminal domain-containing protein n=1 Tax=Halovulum marinum TaxID=2662447 RepID=A0A6L5YXB4_9RHOB|nr:hypothetical protein [Halovulum marinum]MSU88502.1 hypothetical protein [Halovulum marinum]
MSTQSGGSQFLGKGVSVATDEIELAVCGGHMSGLPLNAELTGRGARFLARTATAPGYRMYALAEGPPAGPGLLRIEKGRTIEVETWALPRAADPRHDPAAGRAAGEGAVGGILGRAGRAGHHRIRRLARLPACAARRRRLIAAAHGGLDNGARLGEGLAGGTRRRPAAPHEEFAPWRPSLIPPRSTG